MDLMLLDLMDLDAPASDVASRLTSRGSSLSIPAAQPAPPSSPRPDRALPAPVKTGESTITFKPTTITYRPPMVDTVCLPTNVQPAFPTLPVGIPPTPPMAGIPQRLPQCALATPPLAPAWARPGLPPPPQAALNMLAGPPPPPPPAPPVPPVVAGPHPPALQPIPGVPNAGYMVHHLPGMGLPPNMHHFPPPPPPPAHLVPPPPPQQPPNQSRTDLPMPPWSGSPPVVDELPTGPLLNARALKCNGIKSNGALCRLPSKRVGDCTRYLPTCGKHRRQGPLAAVCVHVDRDGRRCNRLIRWKPKYFKLCAAHADWDGMPCCFMRLPPEVRMMIFAYVLPDLPVTAWLEKPLRQDGVKCTAAVLRLNKQTSQEALSVLYSVPYNLHFTKDSYQICGRLYSIPRDTLPAMDDTEEELQVPDIHSPPPRHIAPMLPKIQNLRIQVCLLKSTYSRTRRHHHPRTRPVDDEHEVYDMRDSIRIVVHSLAQTNHMLHTLTLTMFTQCIQSEWDDARLQRYYNLVTGPLTALKGIARVNLPAPYHIKESPTFVRLITTKYVPDQLRAFRGPRALLEPRPHSLLYMSMAPEDWQLRPEPDEEHIMIPYPAGLVTTPRAAAAVLLAEQPLRGSEAFDESIRQLREAMQGPRRGSGAGAASGAREAAAARRAFHRLDRDFKRLSDAYPPWTAGDPYRRSMPRRGLAPPPPPPPPPPPAPVQAQTITMTTVIIPPLQQTTTGQPPQPPTALPLAPAPPPPALTQMAQLAGLTPAQAWAALQQARMVQGLVQQQAAVMQAQAQTQQQQAVAMQTQAQAQTAVQLAHAALQANPFQFITQFAQHQHQVQQQQQQQQQAQQHQMQMQQQQHMQMVQQHVQANMLHQLAQTAQQQAQQQPLPLHPAHAYTPTPLQMLQGLRPPPPPPANPFLQPPPPPPSALWHQARAAREAGDARAVERARREMFRGALEGVRRARQAAELAERRVVGAYFGLGEAAAGSPAAVASAAAGRGAPAWRSSGRTWRGSGGGSEGRGAFARFR